MVIEPNTTNIVDDDGERKKRRMQEKEEKVKMIEHLKKCEFIYFDLLESV